MIKSDTSCVREQSIFFFLNLFFFKWSVRNPITFLCLHGDLHLKVRGELLLPPCLWCNSINFSHGDKFSCLFINFFFPSDEKGEKRPAGGVKRWHSHHFQQMVQYKKGKTMNPALEESHTHPCSNGRFLE